ncbi:MAG TPA: type II secretion system protein [Clostridiales bacterium]|nr:type II secretion system protein [Clostridiales bacterium]HQP70287.1 type II secretion system protein [Clostridiales bacterium]
MKNIKAFTLIEVLITALLLSFVLAGVGSVLVISSRESERAMASTGGRMLSDAVFNIFLDTIRPAKSLSVVSDKKIRVTSETGSVTEFEFVPASNSLLRNGKKLVTLQFANTDAKITALTFTNGTPASKTVLVKMDVLSKTNDFVSSNGFSSQFYCRNN